MTAAKQCKPMSRPPKSNSIYRPKLTAWITAVIIIRVIAIVSISIYLVIHRMEGRLYRNVYLKDLLLTRKEFIRRRRMNIHQIAEQDEQQQNILIQRALADVASIHIKKLKQSI